MNYICTHVCIACIKPHIMLHFVIFSFTVLFRRIQNWTVLPCSWYFLAGEDSQTNRFVGFGLAVTVHLHHDDVAIVLEDLSTCRAVRETKECWDCTHTHTQTHTHVHNHTHVHTQKNKQTHTHTHTKHTRTHPHPLAHPHPHTLPPLTMNTLYPTRGWAKARKRHSSPSWHRGSSPQGWCWSWSRLLGACARGSTEGGQKLWSLQTDTTTIVYPVYTVLYILTYVLYILTYVLYTYRTISILQHILLYCIYIAYCRAENIRRIKFCNFTFEQTFSQF